MTDTPIPGASLQAMLAALPINPRNLDQLRAIQREVEALIKDRDDWRRELDGYVSSWIRNLGGRIFNKRHRIDALAMTTKQMTEGYRRALRAGLIGEKYYPSEPDPSANLTPDIVAEIARLLSKEATK